MVLVVEASKVEWLSPQFTSQLSAGGVSAPSYLIIVTIAKRPFSADSIALPLFTVKNLEFISRTLIATNSDFEVNVATITGNGWGCKVGKVQVTASQSGISNFTILSGISNFTPYFETAPLQPIRIMHRKGDRVDILQNYHFRSISPMGRGQKRRFYLGLSP